MRLDAVNDPATEEWEFEPTQGDRYRQDQHGYGSDYRNNSSDQNGNRFNGDFGRPITLTAKEFSLMDFLCERRG